MPNTIKPQGRPKGLPKTGGRKPGSVNKDIAAMREVAKLHGVKAITTLAEIMNDKTQPAPSRIAASNSLLDRGFGKPTECRTLNVNEQAKPDESLSGEGLIAELRRRGLPTHIFDDDVLATDSSGQLLPN